MLSHTDENRLSELQEKWADGSISNEEAKEYADWYNAGQDNPVEIPSSFAVSKELHKKRIYDVIKPKTAKITPLHVISKAAAILILAFGLIWFAKNKMSKVEESYASQVVRFKNDVAPGHNGAILTLSNGQRIVLDTIGNGVITTDGTDMVIKKDGVLSYDAKTTAISTEMVYNTLTTDKGRKFQLTLPDGSRVWLNASSSIKFPLNFSGNERLVEVTGEAYFEVKHNANQPFKVRFENQVIEDIGTSFNLNAYKDEAAIKTTLLEGSVRVSMENSSTSSVLKPGQQAAVNPQNDQIKVYADADLDETMAWKNGTFSFKNADINTIMRQVARWYDVDITYQGNIKDTFVADISQQEPISKLLKLLELTDRVHFKIDGKKVTVTP